jgi:hypothetical protein
VPVAERGKKPGSDDEEKQHPLKRLEVAVGAVVVMVGGLTATLKLLTGADALLGWLAVATLLFVGLVVLTVRWWRTRKNSARTRWKSVAQAGGLLAGFAVLGVAIAFLLSAVVVDSVPSVADSTTTSRGPGSTTAATTTTTVPATTTTTRRPAPVTTTTTTTAVPPPPPEPDPATPVRFDPPGKVPWCHDYTGTGDQPPGRLVALLIRQADSPHYYSEGKVDFPGGGVWYGDNKIVGEPGNTGPFVLYLFAVTPAQLDALEAKPGPVTPPSDDPLDERTAIRVTTPNDC